MKLRNKKTGEIWETPKTRELAVQENDISFFVRRERHGELFSYFALADLNEEWEDYEPKEPLIKDEKVRKAVRAWAEAENCTSEMNLYYTLNRQEKYIIFHNPQTGSELQLCEFDYPDFKELCEYTIAELCGEEEE